MRRALLSGAAVVFFGQLLYMATPYLSVNSDIIINENHGTFSLLMQYFKFFLISLPLPLLCLWAAHNLRELKWVSNEGLIKAIQVVIVLIILALTFELAKAIKETAPYFPEIIKPSLNWVLQTFNWFAYSIVEIIILLFAIHQLKLKVKNTSISNMELE